MTAEELIAFEEDIGQAFERGEIRGPVHLSGGNENQLIEIFKEIKPTDWVFSTWRNHYHALLHGVPAEKVKAHILQGPSMNLNFPEHRFLTSAIVGGIMSIACGIAWSIKRAGGDEWVWCFVGDMAATTGAMHEAVLYSRGHDLPIRFIVEDNKQSTNTPTSVCWGEERYRDGKVRIYEYTRTKPHVGIGRWVTF